MAKFNSPKATIKTTNQDGYPAYSMTDKSKLVTQVLTSFFNEKKFYGDNSDDLLETLDRVIQKDPAFVSNLAVFARREFNMRSVAHVLTAHLAHAVEGKPYVKTTVKGVAVRGDDITEIMACYLNTYGRPIPNSLKKGISAVMQGMDEYALAKYKGDSKSLKMRDLVCLCHPKPINHEQAELWKRCLEGKLETPITWETQLSANGNNAETWEMLIDSKKVGYMAMLRNLRNLLKAQPANLDKALAYLSDPAAVRKSKQLPFRFLSAYRSISETGSRVSSKVLDTLEDAISVSVDNLPKIPGKTVIAIDTSGSMSSKISENSDIRCCEIAMLLGMIANQICEDAIVYTFDDVVRQLNVSHRDGLLSATTRYAAHGGGTNMNLPFEVMIRDRLKADRIIVLSDNMCNTGAHFSWRYQCDPVQVIADRYRRETGNNLWVHAIDLQGYGTQQFHGSKTNIIAGWSEKIFEFILLAEQGEETLEERIANYIW